MDYLCRARILTSQMCSLLIQILTLAVSASVFLSLCPPPRLIPAGYLYSRRQNFLVRSSAPQEQSTSCHACYRLDKFSLNVCACYARYVLMPFLVFL